MLTVSRRQGSAPTDFAPPGRPLCRGARSGQLHAHAEQALLEAGSRPGDLWCANDLLGRGSEDCIEYTSLINIRPARGNPGVEVQDPEVRERIRKLTASLLGVGEESTP